MKLETRERAGLIAMLALLLVCASLLLAVLGMPELLVAAAEPEPVPEELAATPEPTPEPVPTPEPTPQLRERTELLTLVNPWHELPEDWETELQLVNDDGEEWHYIDVRCADALLQMIADCKDAGNEPYICSGYRTMEKQQYLFNNKIARLVAAGTDPKDAPEIAAQSVAIPVLRRISSTSVIPTSTKVRSRPRLRNGSWKTPGSTASFCAIPTAAAILPASYMSRGTTAMSALTPRRRYTILV